MYAQEMSRLDLQLFGDGGAGAGAAGADSGGSAAGGGAEATPLDQIRYGKDESAQATQSGTTVVEQGGKQAGKAAERKQAFEALIKGEYKGEFAERTQQIINDRFKQTKTLESQMQQMQPMLQMLAERYGVTDASDVAAISKALLEDDGYYEAEADEKGLTVAQLKQFKQIERENAEFKRTAAERERQDNADRIYQGWMQQAEQVQQVYGDFDLRGEINNPDTGSRFMGLLRSGIDVKTAYEVVHKDDILGGAMAYTAQQTEKRVTDSIRARGMRPQENGGSGSAPATIRKTDVNSLTRKDRDEIARRVMRGERISF